MIVFRKFNIHKEKIIFFVMLSEGVGKIGNIIPQGKTEGKKGYKALETWSRKDTGVLQHHVWVDIYIYIYIYLSHS